MTKNAADLFEATETALAIAGLPEFKSVDSVGQIEVLKYLPSDQDDEEDCWAMVPSVSPTDEYVALDTEMALLILLSHFRNWLLHRGYQVQVHCHANLHRWMLVDCLAAAEGGGGSAGR